MKSFTNTLTKYKEKKHIITLSFYFIYYKKLDWTTAIEAHLIYSQKNTNTSNEK